MVLEGSLVLVLLRYPVTLCLQSEEETPKQLSKDKAHRSGLEGGEAQGDFLIKRKLSICDLFVKNHSEFVREIL